MTSFSSSNSPASPHYYDDDDDEYERRFTDDHSETKLLPLNELCCRFIGQKLPFSTVQLYPSRVPEDLQRRISYWSFPQEEKKLLEYAKIMGGATEEDVEVARRIEVHNMTQSGEID